MQADIEKGNVTIIKEIELLRKENALLSKQLDFLKNQFNGHITLNFLNYCFAHALKTSEEHAEKIGMFAEMIKYSYETKPNEPISLGKEVEYIENFIGIQRCVSNPVYVNFQYDGPIDEKVIFPYILVTFVENAFKYGQFYNKDYPIQIFISATSNHIDLKVSNAKRPPQKKSLYYINQQGTKEMLESFYRDRYQLIIHDNESNYSVELKLQI